MRSKMLALAAALTLGGTTLAAQDAPLPDSAAIAKGRTVYEGKSGGALCISCHGPKGKGIQGLGPDLTDDKWLHGDGGPEFLEAIVKAGVLKPKAGVLTMPPMGGGKLDDAQLKALAAYLTSLRTE